MYRTTVVAAVIASSVGVAGCHRPSVPTAFAWGSNTFTASRRSLVLPVVQGTSSTGTNQQPSPINTPSDKRNTRHSSSSSSLRMTSHGDGKYEYNIRECNGGDDYKQVIGSVDDWWGGRRMTPMLPRLFFEYFSDTSFVAEMPQAEGVDEPAEIVGFVCGFVSPSLPKEAHVHFVGVDPAHRGVGLASAMYKHFFDKMRIRGCDIVHAVTSPSNTASVAFHEGLGFEALRVAGATNSRSDGSIDDAMDGCLDASFDGIIEGTLGESTVDGTIDGTIQGVKGPRDNPHKIFESALEGGGDGTSRVLDEFVHVGWDGPDGGDRVLLQMNI